MQVSDDYKMSVAHKRGKQCKSMINLHRSTEDFIKQEKPEQKTCQVQDLMKDYREAYLHEMRSRSKSPTFAHHRIESEVNQVSVSPTN